MPYDGKYACFLARSQLNIVLFMIYVAIHFQIVYGLFEWKRISLYAGFLPFVSICIVVGDSITKGGGAVIQLSGLTLSHFCACHKPEPGFTTSYVLVFFIFKISVRSLTVSYPHKQTL